MRKWYETQEQYEARASAEAFGALIVIVLMVFAIAIMCAIFLYILFVIAVCCVAMGIAAGGVLTLSDIYHAGKETYAISDGEIRERIIYWWKIENSELFKSYKTRNLLLLLPGLIIFLSQLVTKYALKIIALPIMALILRYKQKQELPKVCIEVREREEIDDEEIYSISN